MRRIPKQRTEGAPPAELLRFTGTTNRERFAWLRARDLWWQEAHPEAEEPDQVGSLQYVIDGHDQAGDFAWCGSIGAPCLDGDCLCTTWPEYRDLTSRPTLETSPRT